MSTVVAQAILFGVRLHLPDDVVLAAVEQVANELSSQVEQDLTVLAEASRNVRLSEGDTWTELCDPQQVTAEVCMDRALVARDDAYNAFSWLDRPSVDLSAAQALDLADALIAAALQACPQLAGRVA